MGRQTEMSVPGAGTWLATRIQSKRNRQPSIADRDTGDRGAEDYDYLHPSADHDSSKGRTTKINPMELDPRKLY